MRETKMTVEIEGQGLVRIEGAQAEELNKSFETFPAPGPVNRSGFEIAPTGNVVRDPVTGGLFEI